MTGPGASPRFVATARAESTADPGGRKRAQRPIEHPLVWRAGENQCLLGHPCPTGFDDLDRHLPGGGWPATGLTEILTEHYGIGELSLLMPALARLGENGGTGCIVWIAPPHIPYAPALHSQGIGLDRVLVVRDRTGARGNRDILWAMEQALRFGSCAAVLAWARSVDQVPLRRLQLAAEAGQCWAVLFRPPDASHQRSPAVLRTAPHGHRRADPNRNTQVPRRAPRHGFDPFRRPASRRCGARQAHCRPASGCPGPIACHGPAAQSPLSRGDSPTPATRAFAEAAAETVMDCGSPAEN